MAEGRRGVFKNCFSVTSTSPLAPNDNAKVHPPHCGLRMGTKKKLSFPEKVDKRRFKISNRGVPASQRPRGSPAKLPYELIKCIEQ